MSRLREDATAAVAPARHSPEGDGGSADAPRSDNLRTMTIKARGEFKSGRSQLLLMIKRLVEDVGMTTRLDADGHNLTITSTRAERIKLFDLNERETP